MYPWAKVPVSIVFGPFLSCKASLSSASQPPYSYYVAYVLNVFTTIHISITYEPGNEAVSKDKWRRIIFDLTSYSSLQTDLLSPLAFLFAVIGLSLLLTAACGSLYYWGNYFVYYCVPLPSSVKSWLKTTLWRYQLVCNGLNTTNFTI